MQRWLSSQWEAFKSSYASEEAAVQSSPGAILLGVGSLVVCMGVLGWVPPMNVMSGFRMPYLPMLLAVAAGACTYVAYRRRATGPLGTACMLADTALYSSSCSLAAALTTGSFSIGFAIALGLFLLTFPASVYALTWPIALAMCTPPLLTFVALDVSTEVAVVFWAGCTLAVVTSYRTGQRRALARQNVQLRNALGAANRIADESMEAGLAAALLNVGQFLHELRNAQAVQRTNLTYLEEEAGLEGEPKMALQDIKDAQKREEKLVNDMLSQLRNRARNKPASFVLQQLVSEVLSAHPQSTVSFVDTAPSFCVAGNPEHMRFVVENLVRNARDAGASQVTVRVMAEASAKAISLVVEDNGKGMDEGAAKTIFEPFGTRGKRNGTGLGLYLSRRYVELMGGTIELEPCPGVSTRFRIRLPGDTLQTAPSLQQDTAAAN